MEKIIDKLLSLMGENNLGNILILFSSLVVYTLYKVASNKRVQDIIINKLTRKVHSLKRENLKFNDYFVQKGENIRAIKNIEFESAAKERLLKDILTITQASNYKIIKVFLEDASIYKCSLPQLRVKLVGLLQMLEEAEEYKIETYLLKKYNKDLCEFVINSDEGWASYRTEYINRLYDYVDMVIHSRISKDNIERLELFLCEFNAVEKRMIRRAEKGFDDFNGELEKMLDVCLDK